MTGLCFCAIIILKYYFCEKEIAMREIKPILPSDIQRLVIASVLKRVIPCVIVEIVVVWYIAFFGETSLRMVDQSVRVLIYIALMILPLVFTGVPLKLIDRSWKGEIIAIEVESNFSAGLKRLYEVNQLVITIKRDDGKIIERSVKDFSNASTKNMSRGKVEYAEDDYAIGDKVYHYYGVPHLLVVHADKSRDCVVCGANNPYSNDRCFNCGHSIIKKTF